MARTRASLAGLLLALGLLTAPPAAHAEEGYLWVLVVDMNERPLPGVQIGTQGEGSIEVTGPSGRARIRLPPGTTPPRRIPIQVLPTPEDWVIVSPADQRVPLLSFSADPDNYARVVLAPRGDVEMLRNGVVLSAFLDRMEERQPPPGQDAVLSDALRQDLYEQLAREFGLQPEQIEQALRTYAETTSDPLEEGRVKYFAGKFDEAEDPLRAAIAQAQGEEERARTRGTLAWRFLGLTHFAQGDFHEAADAFQRSLDLSPDDPDVLDWYGASLIKTGDFAAALVLHARAVELRGRTAEVDHASLGTSLHQVGYCHGRLGDFTAALYFLQRAVEEKAHADLLGRVDHESLGRSLHVVGYCHTQLGDSAAALHFFQRAIEEKAQGDLLERVDHESLGRSLHEVGNYHSEFGDSSAALPYYQRAVEEKGQGDRFGRVDHESLGQSLYEVGYYHTQLGDFAAALPFFRTAVKEKAQGNLLGRVDHKSLGISLLAVGSSHRQLGDFAAALPFYQRAVEEAEQGDLLGRVDHEFLGTSLYEVGDCLRQLGHFAAALPILQRAVEEAEQGNLFGRVDKSLLEGFKADLESLKQKATQPGSK